MPQRADVTYFGAGPASLPSHVLEKAAKALVNYEDTGVGLAEHSHRSKLATDVLESAKQALSSYLEVPDTYEILFMHGGGSGEFSATIYNLIGVWVERERQKIIQGTDGQNITEERVLERLKERVKQELVLDYLITGSWSLKASQEAARLLGPEHVNIVTDARKDNNGKFGKITAENTWKLSKNAAMVYYCDNETVDGVEFPGFPTALERQGSDSEEPIVVADMSSNILSRRIPIEKFSLIFFGAQKNLGTTGITVVIIKKSLLPPAVATPAPTLMRQLGLPIGPIVLSYETIAKNNSLYNTLSIFDVYIAQQVLLSLLETWKERKVDGQEELSRKKSDLIYNTLYAYPETYRVVPDRSVASRMNICFRVLHFDGGTQAAQHVIEDMAACEKTFLAGAEAQGLQGLKGHRSVGGLRASNYNSITLAGAERLVAYLESFAKGSRMSTEQLDALPHRKSEA